MPTSSSCLLFILSPSIFLGRGQKRPVSSRFLLFAIPACNVEGPFSLPLRRICRPVFFFFRHPGGKLGGLLLHSPYILFFLFFCRVVFVKMQSRSCLPFFLLPDRDGRTRGRGGPILAGRRLHRVDRCSTYEKGCPTNVQLARSTYTASWVSEKNFLFYQFNISRLTLSGAPFVRVLSRSFVMQFLCHVPSDFRRRCVGEPPRKGLTRVGS